MRSLLLIAAALALGNAGCLRFGYGNRAERIGPGPDGGVMDAGRRDAGEAGRAATGGGAAAANSSGAGERPAAGSGGRAGDSSNAGTDASTGTEQMDASMDSGAGSAGDSGADSGTDDAGVADSGSLVVYEKCPERPGVLFCDGFEVDDPENKLWSYRTVDNGDLVRSQARANSDAWSLYATTQKSSFSQSRRATEILDHTMSGDAWLRFYDWVPSSVQVNAHVSIAAISESEYPWDGFEFRIRPTSVDLNYSAGVLDSFNNAVFPRDTWVCVELHAHIDAVHGKYQLYLDGELGPVPIFKISIFPYACPCP